MTRDFRSKGLVLNIDINSEVIPFFSSVVQDKDITEESFYPFVDQYIDVSGKETQVKALAFDIFCQYSTVDSKVFSDYYAIWRRRVENGFPVNYDAQYKPQSLISKAYGIDPYEVWFRRTRERGAGSLDVGAHERQPLSRRRYRLPEKRFLLRGKKQGMDDRRALRISPQLL